MNLNVNFFNLIQLLIPEKIRKPKHLAWLDSLLRPLQTLNAEFVAWAGVQRDVLAYNGQVLYLERILNNEFDPDDRSIYIDDPDVYIEDNFVHNKVEPIPTLFIYNKAEVQPILPIYNLSEVAENVDFVVFIPTGINTDADKTAMSAIINRYRAAGKRFKFEVI